MTAATGVFESVLAEKEVNIIVDVERTDKLRVCKEQKQDQNIQFTPNGRVSINKKAWPIPSKSRTGA
jgi:hypothetical protein